MSAQDLPFVVMAKKCYDHLTPANLAVYDQRITALREVFHKANIDYDDGEIMYALSVVLNWLMGEHFKIFDNLEDPESFEGYVKQLEGILANFYVMAEFSTRLEG